MTFDAVPANYVPSRSGKSLLVYDEYTYYLKNLQAQGRKQWYCSSRDMAGCRADVITAPARSGVGDVLFLVRGRHIHGPPSYYFTPDDVRARYLSTTRGGRLLFFEGNTFFINSRRRQDKARLLWYCSCRKSRQCPASILTLNDQVLGQAPTHTHPPKVSSTYCYKLDDD